MSTEVPEATPAPTIAKRLRSSGLLARLAVYTRHHGVWALGVRWLRNISLQRKALLIACCVLVPMLATLGLLLRQGLEQEAQAQRLGIGLRSLQRLADLTHATAAVRLAAMRADVGEPHPPWPPLLAAEQAAFGAFSAATAGPALGFGVQRALDAVAARRAALAPALTSARAASPAAAARRGEALVEHLLELVLLNTDIGRSSGMAAHADPGVHALQEAAVAWLPRLARALALSRWLGAARIEADALEPGRPRDERLAEVLVEARILLSLVQPSLEYGEAEGLLDAGTLRPAVAAIRRHVELISLLNHGAGKTGVGHDTGAGTAATTLDLAGYAAIGARSLEAADGLQTAALTALGQRLATLDAQRRSAAGWQAALLALWLLLAAYLNICTYKVVSGGVTVLCAELEQIGRGNLGIRPRGLGRDELGQAMTTLGASAARMSQLIEAVTQGVSAVAHASREVATGNAGLSRRTGEIGSLIVHVSQRAEAFSGSMAQCGTEVETAAAVIQDMRDDAKRGRKAMSGLRERMAALQGKSREIVQVVSLVEAVAYQTKMLSINASVEAARAGVAGRGFAVVAQEVRALAQRSEAAAKRIGSIVASSVEQIEGGGLMTERADEAVRHTDERSDALNATMQQVVQLTRTGRTQAQQVLEIARQVEESVAGNGRAIEQLADASAALRGQGDGLKRSTQHFVFR